MNSSVYSHIFSLLKNGFVKTIEYFTAIFGNATFVTYNIMADTFFKEYVKNEIVMIFKILKDLTCDIYSNHTFISELIAKVQNFLRKLGEATDAAKNHSCLETNHS